MPIYCYRCRDGHLTEVYASCPVPEEQVLCESCGGKSARSLKDETVNTNNVERIRYSDAMGVNPEQVPEAVKTFPGSEYDSSGRLLIKSRAHKLYEMKRRGYSEIR